MGEGSPAIRITAALASSHTVLAWAATKRVVSGTNFDFTPEHTCWVTSNDPEPTLQQRIREGGEVLVAHETQPGESHFVYMASATTRSIFPRGGSDEPMPPLAFATLRALRVISDSEVET